mgnify:CR=1 FL=1
MTAFAETVVTAFTAYLAAGLVFAVLFVTFGVHRVDEQAKGSGVGFRLIILPGVAALWPLLLARWVRGVPEPPLETNGHRTRAIDGGLP